MDAHEMKIQTLKNYGLSPDSFAIGHFKNPDGSCGHFFAPAEHCFRCMGVCPGYWSLDSLANYAHGNNLIRPGASVWYGMTDDSPREVRVSHSPRIVAV